MIQNNLMEYYGSNFFRARIALSLISGKPLIIKNIRAKRKRTCEKNSTVDMEERNYSNQQEIEEGICEYEAKILKLVDKLCDDTTVQISEDGDELFFKPGFLIGNVVDDTHTNNWNSVFNCGKERNISYFLEFLIMVVPFFKNPVQLKLIGITEDEIDNSVYTLKIMSEHFFKKVLNVNDNFIKINIVKRGVRSSAGLGEVYFFMENFKKINPFDMSESGLVKKITGNLFFHNISPVFKNKFLNSVKNNLSKFTPYVNISTECERKEKNELKIKTAKENNTLPFLTLSLFAHTKKKCLYSTDMFINQSFFKKMETVINSGTQNCITETYSKKKGTEMDEKKKKKKKKMEDEDEENEESEEEEDEEEEDEEDEEEEEEDEEEDETQKGKRKGKKKVQVEKSQTQNTWTSSNNNNNNGILSSCEHMKTQNGLNLKPIDIYERLGFFIALKIVNEAKGFSSIDTTYQWLPLLFMALAEDTAVSKITLNMLTPHTVMLIRLLADFFNVVFDITKVEKTKIESSYLIKCVGVCYRNFSKKAI